MFFQVYLIRDVSVEKNTKNPYPTQNSLSPVRGGESLRRGFTLLDEKSSNLVPSIVVTFPDGYTDRLMLGRQGDDRILNTPGIVYLCVF